jgi:putative MATE family efflux protein
MDRSSVATVPPPTAIVPPPRPADAALAARTRRILEAPVLPTILRLAAPNVVMVVVQSASATLDALFVGRLGTEPLAGISLVLPAWMFMITASGGAFGNSVASAIARAIGSGRRDDAEALVRHALLLALGGALAFSVALLGGGRWLFGAMGGSGATLDAALAYSNLIFAGAAGVWLVNGLLSVLRGTGQMLVPAVVVVGGELVHLALAPTLIFGLGPVPALGVRGAALSLLISYVLRAGVLVGILRSGRAGLPLRLGGPLRRRFFADLLRVALPGFANTIAVNLNVIIITGLVGTFGTFALAGYGVGARLEYLQIPIVFGFGSALVTLVGVNVGAGQLARARRIAFTGGLLAAGVTGSIGLLAALAPALWVGTFSGQPEVLATGERYLRTVGPFYGFFGLGQALYFAAQGGGRLRWPLLAGYLRMGIAAGGGWLAIHLLGGGPSAIFIAVAVSFVVYGVAQIAAVNASIIRR